jgi:hypothetical protein
MQHGRLIAIIGAASGAALGAWLIARRFLKSSAADRDKKHRSDRFLETFNIGEDRSADIIAQFAPALQVVAYERVLKRGHVDTIRLRMRRIAAMSIMVSEVCMQYS